MKTTLIFLSLFPIILAAQDMRNSIGVVTISNHYDNSDHKLEFKNDDGSVWYTLDMSETVGPKDDFKITTFKPDYFLFKIRCTGRTKSKFKVVVNEETGTTKFLDNSSKLKFYTWEEYVLNVFGVDVISTDVKIYDKIGGAIIKEYPGVNEITVPKEIKGEWMRIIWSTTENYPSDGPDVKTGWIKWKENEKIIVTLNHLS